MLGETQVVEIHSGRSMERSAEQAVVVVIHCVRHLLIEDKVVPLDPERGDVVLSTTVASMKMEKPHVGVPFG